MSCDNVITVQELETDKKHSTYYREVITGKAGGTGADIDYATNAVTGQVQKTLPATIDGLDWSYVGKFADGVTFTKSTDFAIDANGTQWIYAGSDQFPKTVPPATVPSEPTYQVVHVKSASAISNANGGSVQDFIDDYDGFTKNLLKNGNVPDNNTPDTESYSKRVDAIINIIEEKVDAVVSANPNNDTLLNNSDLTSLKSLGIIHTGQSLAEGGVGFFNTPTLQPLNSKCFTLRNGPVSVESNQLGITKQILSEKIRATIGNTMSDAIVSRGVASSVFFSGNAWGGKNYAALKKGGSSGVYERCVQQVGYAFAIDSNIVYRAITIIHGEQDGVDNNTSYATNIGQWQSDFNADIKLITGQSEDAQAYICQTATAGGYGNNGGINELTFPTPLQQLIAHNTNPNITLVASKYQYKYADNAHIKNLDQALHGEKYGQAIAHQISTGVKWQPVRPTIFDKNGNQITITFTGSMLTENSPLVFDTLNVNAITNYGFAYSDGSGNTITSVVISEYNKVVITLSGNIGSSPVVAYAYHNGGGVGNQANGYGDRGNLRDSSIFASKCTGENLPNWCVIFRESI